MVLTPANSLRTTNTYYTRTIVQIIIKKCSETGLQIIAKIYHQGSHAVGSINATIKGTKQHIQLEIK